MVIIEDKLIVRDNESKGNDIYRERFTNNIYLYMDPFAGVC